MLSLPHLIVLFVVALVIFGPEKLPELARKLGKITADFRKMTNDFKYALEDEVRELERQTRIREAEIASAVKAAQEPPAPPEGTVGRILPPAEPAAAEPAAADQSHSPEHTDSDSAQAAAQEAVTAPQEKTPDDHNTA